MSDSKKVIVGHGSYTVPKPEISSYGVTWENLGPSLFYLQQIVSYLSNYNFNILFVGERGTGKEVIADYYIQTTGGGSKNWHTINCAGFNDETLLSELFGHKKGSFTGATEDKDGIFKLIKSGGGIFLDELGAASEKFQAALLRVLQTGQFSPFGSNEVITIPTDVTTISATSEVNKIRPDIVDRFKLIHIPPLRYRKDDIPHLINELIKEFRKAHEEVSLPPHISDAALGFLTSYQWPGNIRELKNALEVAIVLSNIYGEDTLTTALFPTIPMPDTEDTSQKSKIVELPAKSNRIQNGEFFKDWPSEDVEETLVDSHKSAPKIDPFFETTIPKEYKNLFWQYHSTKGVTAKALQKQFPRLGALRTVNDNLKRAK